MLPASSYNNQSIDELSCGDSSLSNNKRKALSDYEILAGKELGRGSYGRVNLVREKGTGALFAMKEMSKAFFKDHDCIENLKREIKIHKKLNHPHITKLLHYFEDSHNVYLILQYAENGSLFRYLRRRKRFSEKEAFVYFFQTCLGIDYLHKKSIIHRDLKPENLLLDEKGNIKVCDFGWSAENIGGSRITFCGTLEYMAPEIMNHRPYTEQVDIWALGILLFELLHGRSPFDGKDLEIKKKVLSGALPSFDSSISEEAKDLICSILRSDYQQRLTMSEILSHSWMKTNEKAHRISIDSYIYKPKPKAKSFSRLNSMPQVPSTFQNTPKGNFGGSQQKLFQIQESPYEFEKNDLLSKSYGPYNHPAQANKFPRPAPVVSKFDLDRDTGEKSTEMPISLYGSTVNAGNRRSLSPTGLRNKKQKEEGFFSKMLSGFGCGCVKPKRQLSYLK